MGEGGEGHLGNGGRRGVITRGKVCGVIYVNRRLHGDRTGTTC